MNRKNILVTGGAGFIGSFLVEALLREGNNVICIDNFSTGHIRNIEPYLQNPHFQFIKHDITQPIDLNELSELEPFEIKFKGIQGIYHLAVPTSIKNFEKYRKETALANSRGTELMLEQAVKYKARFLLGSSSVVYGERNGEDQVSEEVMGKVNHLSDRAVYDEGKRFAETLTIMYAKEHGIDARIARIFRVYGPRMALFDGHQIPDFALAAINGEDITVNVALDFHTSLLYVSDAVSGLISYMESPTKEAVLNIGSDSDLTMNQIIDKIQEIVGSSVGINEAEKHNFLSELALPDIKKAKEELGWLPLVRLEDGLKKTIDYVRANKILLTSGMHRDLKEDSN